MDVDLNINNYNYNDLLKLFNLDEYFNSEDLKKCYKMILKTHPDKSGLEPKYFIFYTKAFKILKDVYQYLQKQNQIYNNSCVWSKNKNINEEIDYEYLKNKMEVKKEKEVSTKDLSKIIKKMDIKSFNKKFNEIFEKVKKEYEDEDSIEKDGYGDWLKSNKDYNNDNEKISNIRDMNIFMERKKKELRDNQIIKYNEIETTNNQQTRSNFLINKKQDYYGSDPFSKNKYEDIKHAYTETVIPVTNEDYINRKHFNNINELESFRINENNKSKEYYKSHELKLKEQKIKENSQDLELAYELLKQQEKSNKFSNRFMGYFRQLEN